jgi:hypothetical protein
MLSTMHSDSQHKAGTQLDTCTKFLGGTSMLGALSCKAPCKACQESLPHLHAMSIRGCSIAASTDGRTVAMVLAISNNSAGTAMLLLLPSAVPGT